MHAAVRIPISRLYNRKYLISQLVEIEVKFQWLCRCFWLWGTQTQQYEHCVSGSQKSYMVAPKPKILRIWACKWNRLGNSSATLMFSTTGNSNTAIRTLCNASSCQNSNMAAAKWKYLKPPLIDGIELKFQLYQTFFSTSGDVCEHN